MAEKFGARLRRQREERQIDLISIAEQTKIKRTLLEALERDDVSQWPSGIFRRAYIRTYAQFIGLDPDAVLREFLEVYPDPGDAFASLGAGSETPENAGTGAGPPTRLRTIVDSAIDSLARLRRTAAADAVGFAAAQLRRSPTAPELPADARAAAPSGEAGTAPAPLADEWARPVSHPPPSVPPPAPRLPLDDDSAATRAGRPTADTPGLPATPAVTGGPSAPAEHDDGAHGVRAVEEGPDAAVTEVLPPHGAVLEAIASLCTDFGRAADGDEIQRLLRESAGVLHASGLIVWLWDDRAASLTPVLVHGYSEQVLAHLPPVGRDADNATAAAFRSETTCAVAATAHTSAALVAPLLMAEGCAGVLALELQPGIEPTRSLRAGAVAIAAALAQLVHRFRSVNRRSPGETAARAARRSRPRVAAQR